MIGEHNQEHGTAKGGMGRRLGALANGLSARLLILTALFVMLAEVLIFLPSIGNYRNVWLQNHVSIAEAASIVFLDGGPSMLTDEARESLLRTSRAISIEVKREGEISIIALGGVPDVVFEIIDLDQAASFSSISSALTMMTASPDQQYRVISTMLSGQGTTQIVQRVEHIQRALWVYARNVLILSLIISIITAGLVYLALYQLIVRPIIRISGNMDAFSKAPENASLVYQPSGRQDEIGVAENRLASFQKELRQTLRQRERLAQLGMAVSKINHDMRNILASAQLFSDRLMTLPDPTVQRFTPKVIRTIDRAVDYTKAVLDYGKAVEAMPQPDTIALHAVAEEVAEMLGLDSADNAIAWRNRVPKDFSLHADPEQIFRVLLNLCRNAVQALMEMGDTQRQAELTVSAEKQGDLLMVRVSDNGPGIPDHVAEHIFDAFQGSTRTDGSGLGMTIAAELIGAHGGTMGIEMTSPAGTVFLITLHDVQAA